MWPYIIGFIVIVGVIVVIIHLHLTRTASRMSGQSRVGVRRWRGLHRPLRSIAARFGGAHRSRLAVTGCDPIARCVRRPARDRRMDQQPSA